MKISVVLIGSILFLVFNGNNATVHPEQPEPPHDLLWIRDKYMKQTEEILIPGRCRDGN